MSTQPANEISAADDGTFLTLTRATLVFKKAMRASGAEAVALLEIPKGTRVYVGPTRGFFEDYRKCRAERAIVHGFFTLDEKPCLVRTLRSDYDPKFKYEVGRTVVPNGGFSDIEDECEPGIHFFATFEEARDYR